LNKLAELAQKKSFERLDLNECSLSFAWRYPEIEIKDITIEEKGKFRIEGEISIKRPVLRGTIRLGLTREYLDWLPNPEEVFSRRSSGYLWTDVHLSGTIDEPRQDLSQRIIELFKESPGAYLEIEGRAPASLHTLIMPAENIEFTLEMPVLSVRDVTVSNWIVHYILPLLGV